jgi:DnaK suppressor protein
MDDPEARELLARERARIERALGRIAPEEDPEEVTDPFEGGDEGDRIVSEELDEAQEEQLNNELEAIERAEERLVQGTFGLSVQSGEPIPDERLRAIPWAERTVEEQARFGG